jgi:NADH:ubiquinone oxidoreductase subunit K
MSKKTILVLIMSIALVLTNLNFALVKVPMHLENSIL